MRWLRGRRGRRSHRGDSGRAGMVELPPVIAQSLLAIREREQISQRRALAPGSTLPEGATLRAARQAGLHPAVDPIGQQTRAALECWARIIGGDVPQTVAAWASEQTATILLAGPLDPMVGVPSKTGKALGLEVGFRQYGPWKPDKHYQLVLATVEGGVTPGITPDPAWAADGLLVPFGSTRAGVFYLPLLGSPEAGPLAISGPAAPELVASILVFALARVGAGRVRGLVYNDLLPFVEGLIEAEPFDITDLKALSVRLEEEWKRRALQITAAHAEDLRHYALLPDVEPIPLLVFLIGPQAATEMGLLDPDWPYVLKGAGNEGIPILVWGDVATAPRRVHASYKEATFALDVAENDLIAYEISGIEFTPTLLARVVREEVAAVLGVRRLLNVQAKTAAPTQAVEETLAPEEARTIEQASADPVVRGTGDEAPLRRLYLLGGVRAVYADAAVEGWRRRQALELLAFLAAHPEGRSADAVSEAIWPDGRARSARTHLRQLVREARVRLGGDSDAAPIVLLRDGSYRLDWQSVWADVVAFRRAIERARRADDPDSDLREAVSLYRGEFCKDAYYSWNEPSRREFERLYLDAAIRLADLLVERGDLEEAHRIVDDALALNPYVDAVVQRALVLDARRFGVRGARERLRGFRARLREDLDAEPDPRTVAVLEAMIRELDNP